MAGKLLLAGAVVMLSGTGPLTPYEKGARNVTATYAAAMRYYHELDSLYDEIRMIPYGATDAGEPLHLVVVSMSKTFNPAEVHKQGKAVVMVMNGIHPGEPEGIDASMMLARDLVEREELRVLMANVVLAIIPVYNIGGALKRNSYSRPNQNGPVEYGFRGNSRNLDLNRDFIKCDSKESRTFATIRNLWNPHIFIDTHTSNGADYQYVLTVIATQKDKLHPGPAGYLREMTPKLEEDLRKTYEMIPYVQTMRSTPDSGIVAFLETPRYSTGYTALFNIIGFTVETHMLKPYKERVNATYEFIKSVIRITNADCQRIRLLQSQANELVKTQLNFPVRWELDSSKFQMINFKGYAPKVETSKVTGRPYLAYDQSAPYEKPVRYFDTYVVEAAVKKPYAYIIPEGWWEIRSLMELNGVRVYDLKSDTTLEAESYYIDEYRTADKPFESHFPHYNIRVRSEKEKVDFHKGDLVIYLNQPVNRFIIETLEPVAHDSYFSWNFFDEILQQKEWYSSYVFEERAAELLETDPELKARFEERKKSDLKFASSPSAQLRFIYLNSPHYEKDVFLRYPVSRLMLPVQLPIN